MKKIASNINNLTSLWKTAATPYQGYHKETSFESAYIQNAQWPNRIWTNLSPSKNQLKEVQQQMLGEGKLFTFSLFTLSSQENNMELDAKIKLKSTQYGMSLELKEKFETQRQIDFKRVKNKEEAGIWSNAFFKAFNYEISTATILKTKETIPYYLVYFEQELVGTIILYTTNTIAGLHSLGIIPEKRKQGFATEIMRHTLNKAIDQNLSLATLQASEMAKEMYLKLGFSLDFLMENYILNTTN
ncbi:GNAT family N-acetyltransferase [Tenacibaculum mesophilum]|uniref:GNAT family N-acetyltransferase n=1 Tax=Tenacibaculum mesophilum TaxID=104268 RepID=UPI002490E512|nr:GNAT family N-acetyltransferase [Tenacibaculum mesophilum]